MQQDLWRLEGASWLSRNREHLTWDRTTLLDPILTMFGLYPLGFSSLLDIGASNGWRAAWLAKYYGCQAAGVDISPEAIAEGRERYPNVDLRVASATSLPVAAECIDLVLCVFVCHCLDADSMALAVSEIDRVLMPRGCLLLADFAPDVAATVPWHHREGLFTYKRPRAGSGCFTDTGRFREIACLSWDHDTHRLVTSVPSDRRAAVVLLQKEG